MILRIRHSFFSKIMSISMVFLLFFTMVLPFNAIGLTGGPSQPEFNAFTPIGTSDMVDLSSGDFSYNIPIMDIGGFPINLAYNSGITMDQEASWVGLGWNLSVGQINRQMRGIPDDFDGDEMTYENNMKPNRTIGTSFNVKPNFAGLPPGLSLSLGLSAKYNNYTGFSMAPSAGISYDISNNLSAGMSVQSDENGLTVSPNVSLKSNLKSTEQRDRELSSNVGLSINSREGLTKVNMSTSYDEFTRPPKREDRQNAKRRAIGSSVSYVNTSHTPSIEQDLNSKNFTFNGAAGGEIFGIEVQGEISAYSSTQKIADDKKIRHEKAYGYEHTHKSIDKGVKDFNREKDGNFSVNSTNLPITNYTYDLYSVKGQGVSGMFRPFRSQVGFVNDNQSKNSGLGVTAGGELGAGNLFHIGFDLEVTANQGKSGLWESNNDALAKLQPDHSSEKPDYEEVYFKNVGDLSADEELAMYGTASTKFGSYFPARLSLGTVPFLRGLKAKYEIKDEIDPNVMHLDGFSQLDTKREKRVKRNQSIQPVRKDEITKLNSTELLGFVPNFYAKDHHTAGYIITRNDGARYIYGEALYNITKEEVTFAAEGLTGDCSTGLVAYSAGDNSISNSRGDQYFNKVVTPPYAHTYLLTTLLSTDYSDIDGNGPTDNDLGSYTKFTYSYNNAPNKTTPKVYNWRVPLGENSANFNEGLKTDPTDDKGSYVYGQKEVKYIDEIETKTHIAVFIRGNRQDAQGVSGENGGVSSSNNMEQLNEIRLYSKAEYFDANGNVITNAIPIKTAHFVYDYELCQGAENANGGGKLTLKKVYFTYRNSNMGQYSAYQFTYNSLNPNYNLKAYDIWGNYKKNFGSTSCNVDDPITVPEFNYVEQNNPALIDSYTSAWSLTDIDLPSGGKIHIEYESDDYAYVQNKKAMQMYKVVGAGNDNQSMAPNSPDPNEDVFFGQGSDNNEEFLYIELPDEFQNLTMTLAEERAIHAKLITDINSRDSGLVYFRFLMNMNKVGGDDDYTVAKTGYFDYVTGYFEIQNEAINSNEGKIFNHTNPNGTVITYASIKMKLVNMEGGFGGGTNVNPISKAGWNFGRKYLSRYIYGVPDQNMSGLNPKEVVNGILQTSDNLLEIFIGPNGLLRSKKIARRFIPKKSWIRLSNINAHKKGGGSRVKSVRMFDEWDEMTSNIEDDQEYGQEYEYDLENGHSSGVATYEPVGSKENPFVQPSYVNTKRLLAPNEENFIEKPFGESFFPSPQVTYSKVSVKNLERRDDVNGTPTNLTDDLIVKKHATGRVVTEFYTSKDFPTLVDQTKIKVHEDKNDILAGLLNLSALKYLTLSQGYVVHLNDMNGKMKKQRVFAEGQDDAISGADYHYNVTEEITNGPAENLVSNPRGELDNEVYTLSKEGVLIKKTIGVEYDIINDMREKKTTTEVVGINANMATMMIGPFPIVLPVPLPDFAIHRDQLRMVTTTKVINSFGILKETVAYDAGAAVSTKNLVWDDQTGEVLVTETVNEYNTKYYSFNLPANWHYDRMGAAAINTGLTIPITDLGSGIYSIPGYQSDAYLVDGDEIILWDASNSFTYGWVDAVTSSDFKVIDRDGLVISGMDGLKVMRSGRRNLQSTSMGSYVLMENPIDLINGAGGTIPSNFLDIVNDWAKYRIVNAGAVEFSEDWDLQCNCNLPGNTANINPYLFNKKGVWRAIKSHLYLTKRQHTRENTFANDSPDPRNDGFYQNFSPFYQLVNGTWQINTNNWTHTSEVTDYSPYGFELENKDALNRYSSAQYGYNHMFPMAVSANAKYSQMGFDGFEDYDFNGCDINAHFGFRNVLQPPNISGDESHTGRYSLKVTGGSKFTKSVLINCIPDVEGN